MNWILAALRTTKEAVLASLKRIVVFCQDSFKNGLKRWWLVPIATGVALGIGLVSPIVLGSMLALMVNDIDAHPTIRLAIDMAAVGVAVSVALLAPAAVVVGAIVPIGDLMNRWIDEVIAEKGRLDGTSGSNAVADSCREGQLPVSPAGPEAAPEEGGQRASDSSTVAQPRIWGRGGR